MAIDLRTPFPEAVFSWPWLLGLIGFVAYPIAAVLLLRRGLISRLTMVGVLAPWLLFATSFAAVLYQEPFVLYRSYYWALPASLLVALAVSGPKQAMRRVVAVVVGMVLFGLTWNRLAIFSDPVRVWSECIDYLRGDDHLPGTYRLYINRGVALAMRWERQGNSLDIKTALNDFDKVVAFTPQDASAYINRGQAKQALGDDQSALADYSQSIQLAPTEPEFRLRRGMLLRDLGQTREAKEDLAIACINHKLGCDEYMMLNQEIPAR